MTKINLHLEPNENGYLIYYPRHCLKGTVKVTLDQVKKFKGLYITIFGEATAYWTETKSKSTDSSENRRTMTYAGLGPIYTAHFEGKEVYLNSRTYLFGQNGGSLYEMQPGLHRYEFVCQLPDLLPYSLELKHGSIKYHAKAVLDVPGNSDKEIEIPFNLVRNDDLNLYPELRIVQKSEKVKTFCCLINLCKSGPLIMTVTIPYSGFALGQDVKIKIDYFNQSNIDVTRTIIRLKRTISFTSHTPERKTKTDTENMADGVTEGVKGGESKYIETCFKVPRSMMCSNGKFCKVVTISYFMEIEGEVDGCYSNLKISLPIVIGSIPIKFDKM